MKEFVVRNKMLCFVVVLAVASVGYNVSQQTELGKVSKHKELLRDKESLLQDGYNDVMIGYLREIRDQNLEVARGQGRIEGMLSIINNFKPDSNLSSAVWHDGYYRGLRQVEDMKTATASLETAKAADPDGDKETRK